MLMTCEEGDMGRYGEVWGDVDDLRGRERRWVLLLLPLLRTVALVCYYYCHLVRQPLKVVDSVGKVLPEAGHLKVGGSYNVPTHQGQCCRRGEDRHRELLPELVEEGVARA